MAERKIMVELTEQQIQAVEVHADGPPTLVNPRTHEMFVLLSVGEYERLRQAIYDDSPWTKDELQALAWEAGKQAGWDDMDEYDRIPE
jgi:PHD/YefM family antitoxin component YafN of YafNO toxin-antitoxin module